MGKIRIKPRTNQVRVEIYKEMAECELVGHGRISYANKIEGLENKNVSRRRRLCALTFPKRGPTQAEKSFHQ